MRPTRYQLRYSHCWWIPFQETVNCCCRNDRDMRCAGEKLYPYRGGRACTSWRRKKVKQRTTLKEPHDRRPPVIATTPPSDAATPRERTNAQRRSATHPFPPNGTDASSCFMLSRCRCMRFASVLAFTARTWWVGRTAGRKNGGL